MVFYRTVPAILLIAVLALTACGNSTTGNNGSSTTSTTATPAVTPGIESTTSQVPPVSIPPSETTAYLTAVAVTSGKEDRVVFTFEDGLPGYTVSYIDGPLLSDGEGAKVDIEGAAIAKVVFERASTAKLTGGYTKTYNGPDRIEGSATRVVREAVKAGDFEARLTWGIGTSARAPFTITRSEATSAIVITFS